MNALDSRFIRQGSCFAHRFSTPGRFPYTLSPISLSTEADQRSAQAVVVRPGSGNGQRQHIVTVTRSDNELVASPDHLEVAAGDLVTWHADQSAVFGFRVRGIIDGDLVDSASLQTESIFSHAFGLAGSYEWADANGSSLHGCVKVSMPDGDGRQEAWLDQLRQGTLIHIRGDRAEPEEVNILVAQTVIWAVEDAPGVTITDVTLLGRAAGR